MFYFILFYIRWSDSYFWDTIVKFLLCFRNSEKYGILYVYYNMSLIVGRGRERVWIGIEEVLCVGGSYCDIFYCVLSIIGYIFIKLESIGITVFLVWEV